MVEAVIGPDSVLAGRSVIQENLHTTHGVKLLAVGRSGFRIARALRTLKLRAGDVLVIQGAERSLPGVLKTLGLLPLAERAVRLGDIRRVFAPAIILAAAMVLVALDIAPVAIAFFGAAVLMVAVGAIRMREAYTALDGPLLVLIAALIPVSDAIRSSGGADLIARTLAELFEGQAPILALGAVMAVAMGAACDFLTPIGHQCNTLVMAPGGYRFIDYSRLGAPLSLIVLVVGTALIALVWPLTL